MIRNLLDPKTEQSAEFIKKQEERRKMRLNDQIYDITAWNLPMLFDVELVTSPSAITVKTTRRAVAVRRAVPGASARRGEGRLPDAVGIRRRGAVGRCDAAGHSHSQRRRRVHAQRPPLSDRHRVHPQRRRTRPISHAKLSALAVKHGAELVPIDSTWVDDGTSLGSNDVAALKTPKILLAWDTPTQSLSAGWTRYTLERRFGVAVTAVRTSSLGRANFNDYDVIVLPSGNYGGADQRRRAQSHQGLAAQRRHAGDAGRGIAMGDRIQRRPARHDRPA